MIVFCNYCKANDHHISVCEKRFRANRNIQQSESHGILQNQPVNQNSQNSENLNSLEQIQTNTAAGVRLDEI